MAGTFTTGSSAIQRSRSRSTGSAWSGSSGSQAWILPGLFCLLNIELCSFSLSIPDNGIEGAVPVDRPSGDTLSKS